MIITASPILGWGLNVVDVTILRTRLQRKLHHIAKIIKLAWLPEAAQILVYRLTVR